MPAVKANAMRSLLVTIFEEIHFNTRRDALASMLKSLCVGSLSTTKTVLESALECIGSLAVCAPNLEDLDKV
jgi:hypothetical protein